MPTHDPAALMPAALRASILRSAVGICLYGGALGVSFGAVAAGGGLTMWQTMVLSLVMFSGGSQFAFVGAMASPWAAMSVALLLAVRNAFYGVRLSSTLGPLGYRRPLTAHLVLDESTAMSIAQPEPRAARFAFYATGISMFACWQTGSLIGVLIGRGVDTHSLGLDVAAPAAFIALLWPGLTTTRAKIVALSSAVLAFLLIPVAPAGVPVLLTVLIAVVVGLGKRQSKEVAQP